MLRTRPLTGPNAADVGSVVVGRCMAKRIALDGAHLGGHTFFQPRLSYADGKNTWPSRPGLGGRRTGGGRRPRGPGFDEKGHLYRRQGTAVSIVIN